MRSSASRFLQIPNLRRLLGVIVVTYGAVVLLTSVFQTRFIFFPSRTVYATPASVGLDFEDLMLPAADGVTVSAWYVPRIGARGTILFLHGNAGNNGDRVDMLRVLHSLGYSVLIVDYRGYGKSEGRPTETGVYLDAIAGWNYLTEDRRIPPGLIVLMGESLGGAVAIELGARYRPGALVVQSSFTRLADVAALHYPFFPVQWMLRHRFESIDKVGRIGCPKLFIHSQDDTLIPLAMGRTLFEAARDPKTFLETPGGHNDGGFMYSPEYAARLKAFLDSVLPQIPEKGTD